MTQEDKKLLLKDLCGRLPYNVQIHGIFTNIDYSKDEDEDGSIFENEYDTYLSIETFDWFIHGAAKIKPYLRPMLSMSEEEFSEYQNARKGKYYDEIDWLNAHHFDFRGLIPMGLALEAPNGMYNI